MSIRIVKLKGCHTFVSQTGNKMAKDTKDKLLETAHSLFEEKGFDGVSMREIAEEAKVNKGLLHYYFKSKQAVFLGVFKIVSKLLSPLKELILVLIIKIFLASVIKESPFKLSIVLNSPLIFRLCVNSVQLG